MSGVVINPYGTWWWYLNNAYHVNFTQADVDYWMGGLVAGGVAPQIGGWSDNATLVGVMRAWIQRYKQYGHMTEDGIRSLYYDQRCNHVNGVSEWIACDDIVLSMLAGGQMGGVVTGLYVGSPRSVELKPEWAPNNSTLVVFGAANVTHVHVDVGAQADTRLNVDFMSAGLRFNMSGGFWNLHNQNVIGCVTHRDGTKSPCRKLFTNPPNGQASFQVVASISDQWVFHKVTRETNRVGDMQISSQQSMHAPHLRVTQQVSDVKIALSQASNPNPDPNPNAPHPAPDGFAALLVGDHDARGTVLRPVNFTLTQPGAAWERAHSTGFFSYEQTFSDYGSYVLRTHLSNGTCRASANCNPKAVGQSAGCQGMDCSGFRTGSDIMPHTVPLKPNRRYILAAVIHTNFSRVTTEVLMNVFLFDNEGRKLNSTLAGGGLPSSTLESGAPLGVGFDH